MVPLRPGDQVPHFDIVDLEGRRVRYRDLWQNRNLVLVALADEDSAPARGYRESLRQENAELTANDTTVVVYSPRAEEGGAPANTVPGLPVLGVLIADRWGEIHHVAAAADASGLPGPPALIEWLRYVQRQCPECQGETR